MWKVTQLFSLNGTKMLEHSTTGLWTQKHRDSGNNFRVPKKVSVPGRSSFISFSFPPVISSRFCMSSTIWGNEKCLDRPLITCIMELCLRLLVVSLNKHHFWSFHLGTTRKEVVYSRNENWQKSCSLSLHKRLETTAISRLHWSVQKWERKTPMETTQSNRY